ncbi:hypothetical protein EIP91_009291 [Steccherinum ochraceum]|uniref:Uncharacterized protein n=1 Tax=Steccherinum ochraceum TaxID=92696 RepID=A0A4R0RBA8_9APHY|nr:hypothetical protein EIP91_009291 [Steccherinum ochraceum]
MDPLPYNVTVSSQTASIVYAPKRDGDPTAGWNVTYSSGTSNTGFGVPQGVGTDSHWTTHDGASLQLSWVGTAVYLYGDASPASYSIDVDGTSVPSIGQGGVLASKTGLDYGNHTVTLTTHGANQVRFQHAEVTVGLGYNSGPPVQNRTIFAVEDDNTTPNSFFSYVSTPGGNTWHVEDAKFVLQADGIESPFPRQMLTASPGDSVSFTVTQTTAFFLYGAVNADHLPKTVSITPSSNPSQIRRTIINDFSSALDFKQILYWESGLDRDETYTVQIAQIGPGETSLSFSSLDLLDGGPVPSGTGTSTAAASNASAGAQMTNQTAQRASQAAQSTSQATQTANQAAQAASQGSQTANQGVQTGVPSGVSNAVTGESTRLSTGVIAGISVVCVTVLILSIVVALLFRRHKRFNADPGSDAGSSFDAGPDSTISLPPAYESRWADRRIVSTPSPSPRARLLDEKRRW